VRREAYVNPFVCISMFSLCRGYNIGMAELSEFCFVCHDLIFDSNLVTCRLKGPVSREAYVNPFFHISIFSLCSTTTWVGQSSVSSAYFSWAYI
jgi:hypothetical protein